MTRKRSLIRAGAVLAVALAAGHLVQTLNAPDERAEGARPTDVETVSAGEEATLPKADPALPAAASLTAAADASADGATPAEPLPEAATAGLIPPAAAPAPETAPGTAVAEAPALPPDTALAALEEDIPASPDPAIAPPVAPVAPVAVAPAAPAPALASAADPVAPSADTAGCTPELSLVPGPQAMIAVSLSAPCNAGQRVVLRHAGMAIAEQIGLDGTLSLDLPALTAAGEVSVLFADATILRDAAPVPAAETLQRFVVQWMAEDSFQIHVLEGGATYGEPGHVWSEMPVSSNGGLLVSLGDPTLDLPMMAQVYTWPADTSVGVAVTVESVVTEATCDRELLGETIHATADGVVVKDLTLAMPACDALGDILVLNNLVPDVTLAAAN